MAQHETRQIASYLRNGSLWIGHFVLTNGQLNFGDDRFDAANGLANLACGDSASSTNEPDPRMQAWKRSAEQRKGGTTANEPKLEAVVERLKLAA
jgi:hypothetical protein